MKTAEDIEIVRCRRRSIALIITDDAKLVIRAPHHVPLEFINGLIEKKRAWIERKRAEMTLRPKPLTLTAGEREALMREAGIKLRERCAFYAGLTGYKPASVSITGARRRWGSCGPTGTLNFSWRLARAPEPVIDYVVVHELAHLAERNHSKRFWDRVAAVMPDYKIRRRWLRENGHRLEIQDI